MGFGGISIWQLLIVLAIVVLIFGTKKLKNMGSDVGGAVKNFKDAMKNEDKTDDEDEDFHQRLSSEDDSPEDGGDEKSSREQSHDNDRQS